MTLPKFLIVPTATALLLAGCTSNTTPVATSPETAPNATTAETPLADNAMVTTPTPAASAKNPPANYRVRGEVAEILPPDSGLPPMLMVKHEDIPDFMPAMKMRLPLAKPAEVKKVKVGDKISFNMKRSNVEISDIQILPPDTKLKLAE